MVYNTYPNKSSYLYSNSTSSGELFHRIKGTNYFWQYLTRPQYDTFCYPYFALNEGSFSS